MEALLPLAEKIGARLKERGETIGIAESSTGGLLSAALLSIGGASAYFRGGGVIYTAYARQAFLGYPESAARADRTCLDRTLCAAPRRHRSGSVGRTLGARRNGCDRSDRQPLRRQRGPHLHRGHRRGLLEGHHPGDGESGSHRQHAGLWGPGVGTAG